VRTSSLLEAIRHPYRGSRYVWRRFFADTEKDWKKSGKFYTWNSYDWGGGNDPPQFNAINYHVYNTLTKAVSETYANALDFGCGYGRITPWLSEFADQVYGIDPNQDMVSLGGEYYPEINFLTGAGQSIPLKSDSIELVWSRSVLQHIPPSEIAEVASELQRVLKNDGKIIMLEDVDNENMESWWPRSEDEYKSIFAPLSLQNSWFRDMPAHKEINDGKLTMVFTN